MATAPIAPNAGKPTVSAQPDDNTPNSRTTVNQQLNKDTNPSNLITPRNNVLDQFASYTYNIAWYGLTVDQFNAIRNTAKIDISGWSLLVQSGGAAQQQDGESQPASNAAQFNKFNGPVTKLVTPNRNKYFTLDYYLDDLVIKSKVTGANAIQNGEISFKVSEPNGITLFSNLNYAMRDLTKTTPVMTQYCLVIKFYGWDIEGNLITDPTKNTGSTGTTPTISNAIITRYYPFIISKIDFKIDGKNVVYEVKGSPVPYNKASSSSLGSIPANLEFTGETVNQVLGGTKNSLLNLQAVPDGRETTNTSSPSEQSGPVVRNSSADVPFNTNTNVI